MNKAWRIVSMVALVCFIIGVVGVCVGFFTGSSPVIIQTHGSLEEYTQRLQTNWDILRQSLSDTLAVLGL